MELLYKYYSISTKGINYSVENLRNDLICFSSLECLNDPFEGFGAHTFKVSNDEQKYWDSIGSDLPKLLEKRISKDSREFLNFNYRVFCATKKYDNPLLWSHYANSHMGFCVGYAKSDINELSKRLAEINYTEKMPFINSEERKIESLLYFKSKEWGYEEEWRAVYKLEENDVIHLDFNDYFDEDNKLTTKLYIPHGYAQTNNLELLASDRYITKKCKPQAIYLGLKMNWQDRKDLIEIGKQKNIKIYQMVQEINSFKMGVTPVFVKT